MPRLYFTGSGTALRFSATPIRVNAHGVSAWVSQAGRTARACHHKVTATLIRMEAPRTSVFQ